MNTKVAIAGIVIILVLAGGGFLLWQNSQAAVKDLNSALPEGVRVVKSLFGNEYKVVNKIDGYEFKVPREWHELRYVAHEDVTNNAEFGYRQAMNEELQLIISSETAFTLSDNRAIDSIDIQNFHFNKSPSLEEFIEQFKSIIAREGSFGGSKISFHLDNFATPDTNGLKLTSILTTRHGSVMDPRDEFYIFLKDDKIYVLSHYDDDLVNDVISNGKW